MTETSGVEHSAAREDAAGDRAGSDELDEETALPARGTAAADNLDPEVEPG